jgi:hypothetical protein
MAWFASILRLLLLIEIENNMLKYGLNPTPGEGQLGFYKAPSRVACDLRNDLSSN